MLRSHFGIGSDAKPVLEAIGRSLAIIEFEPTGKVITANANFLQVLRYDLSEVKGQHHSMFVDPDYARSHEYKEFWAKLGRGEFDAREYKRIGKGGREVWIQASYNPIVSKSGKVLKVVKVAADVTAQKLTAVENAGKLEAISRVQAVIEFKPDGQIITANENFLQTLGYTSQELQGQHHRLFVDPTYAASAEYQAFWQRLNRGEFIAQEFKRIGKGGKEVWIQASYNPIFDLNKKVMKVVKYATDVTGRVLAVNQIGEGLSRLADGNLKQDLQVPFIPDLERLRIDFNNSVRTLNAAVSQVGLTAGTIKTGAHEISLASDELSKRTEQQAASLEETAAALEEITATVKRTAEGTQHARTIVEAAKHNAEHSGTVVQSAVAAMSEIEKSSKQISQIIGVIDEIAFQTNLLALNAGVEAARAGDAGRGFAVVASEVRALAQRSAEAAKEIKGLISTSSAQVVTGVGLVGETGTALTRIVQQVTEIAGVVIDIAASTREQATGLDEVNTAVNQMDQITQQNAAMVEESTAAGHSLAQEVEHLNQLISQFSVDGQPAAMPASIKRSSTPAKPGASSKPRVALRVASNGRSALALKPQVNSEAWEDF